ncbi:hypothetical protein AB0M46_10270 [Dactylosporangium sp. NPDC051485]|uniref:hypothetical protein n=1 Tax=Dactylosporangium sp. NPDC051485 TaxID=3154846 RepID=UPI00341CAA4B
MTGSAGRVGCHAPVRGLHRVAAGIAARQPGRARHRHAAATGGGAGDAFEAFGAIAHAMINWAGDHDAARRAGPCPSSANRWACRAPARLFEQSVENESLSWHAPEL